MKYKVTIFVAVMGLIIVGLAGIKLTSQPTFCASCHAIKPLVQAWETSSHRKVSCFACHAEPGFKGLVKRKAAGVRELYVHLTNPKAVPKTNSATWAFSLRCLDCHQEIDPEHPEQLSQLAHNRRHFEIEMPCTTCHVGLVHREEQFPPLPTRGVCSNCHGSAWQ